MIFGKDECRRTGRTSNEDLPKSAKIAAFWQGLFNSCPAYKKLRNDCCGVFSIFYDYLMFAKYLMVLTI